MKQEINRKVILWFVPLVGIIYLMFCVYDNKYWFVDKLDSRVFKITFTGLFVQVISMIATMILIFKYL